MMEGYRLLEEMIARKLQHHQAIVVLDIHSYNHRRMGPKAPFDDPMQHPEINLGPDAARSSPWERIIDVTIKTLQESLIMGRYLDVRENVKF